MDRKDFISFIEHVNKDYQFCVVDMTSQSNNPEDFILLVRASQPLAPAAKKNEAFASSPRNYSGVQDKQNDVAEGERDEA